MKYVDFDLSRKTTFPGRIIVLPLMAPLVFMGGVLLYEDGPPDRGLGIITCGIGILLLGAWLQNLSYLRQVRKKGESVFDPQHRHHSPLNYGKAEILGIALSLLTIGAGAGLLSYDFYNVEMVPPSLCAGLVGLFCIVVGIRAVVTKFTPKT